MQQVDQKIYSVYEALELALQNNLTFACYRLPGNQDVTLILQDTNELQELHHLQGLNSSRGFLIAPFWAHNGDKTYLLRPDWIFRNQLNRKEFQDIKAVPASPVVNKASVSPQETTFKEYLDRVEETIRLITNKEYDKVVLSRVKNAYGSFRDQLHQIFKLLCQSYPNAFVYIFSMEGHCWAGATPEPLLCSKNDELITVSLASTRTYSEENTHIHCWNHKERKEQEYVTEYIENVLNEYRVKNYLKNGPYTKQAGGLLHLRTDFTFPYSALGSRLPNLIQALHPTSAVCGMPMKKSLEFIKSVEKHNREYYAGYLGPVGIDDRLQLFVNLRCMKVLDRHAALYVGGGITSESVAREEWEETEIKANTLLSIMDRL